MKQTAAKSNMHTVYKAAGIILFVVVMLLIICTVFYLRYTIAFTFAAQTDDYEVRSRLLIDAMERLGACTPIDAAETWAEGLYIRSAALQYAVMSSELKEKYKAALEVNAPNWVTGVSSPWIDSYEINKLDSPDASACLFGIKFSTLTSTGPAGRYRAVLKVVQENGFWRVSKLVIDPELFPYTRFMPNS